MGFSVLFVCTGNICRSPTAEGVMMAKLEREGLAEEVVCDSAGTHAFHVGDAPDAMAQRHAVDRGYDLSSLRARKVEPDDFHRFDLILAMDHGHRRLLERQAPPGTRAKVVMFLDFARHLDARDVPDPYHGDAADYDYALDLIEAGTDGLLRALLAGELAQR
ncbi:MAG: low molecular weight protein-tyrosine-phosphatase [Pseudomonadota bacterium]